MSFAAASEFACSGQIFSVPSGVLLEGKPESACGLSLKHWMVLDRALPSIDRDYDAGGVLGQYRCRASLP